MSDLLSELKIFENCDFKNDIKYYHVWDEGKHKSSLFVTNDDKVYGINIDNIIITLSYRSVSEENKNKNLSKLKPIEIKELSDKKIKEFHIGRYFVLALSEENKLYSWGNNDYGQLGRDCEDYFDRNPTEIIHFSDSISNIKQICVCSFTVMVLLDNGNVVVWGVNKFGYKSGKSRFGKSITEIFGFKWWTIRKPRELNSLKEIEFLHMNFNRFFAINKICNVFSWGYNKHGELGHEGSSFISKPKISEILSKLKIITIKSYVDMTYYLSSNGKLYICGKDCRSNESISDEINLIQIKRSDYFTQLESISYYQIIALSDEQIVYELKGKELLETKYKSIEEYCVKKYNNTFKTFLASLKNSNVLLTKDIGHGAFGKVYEVFFQTQYFAIKKIIINEVTRSYLDDNIELKMMKQLKSDFVVNLYDYWIKSENDFEFLYIQMELCDQTLEDIIETKNSSIPPIIDYIIRTEIFGQLLFALNYLHSMTPKVIHRDIKPSNVLIKYHNDHAQCKLCDFGLAKILVKETSNTSYVGTKKYRAPEIFGNKYNEKVDIYSLGITTKELFENIWEINSTDFDLFHKLRQMKSVITMMIHGEPEERPSAEDIINNKNDWFLERNDELFELINNVKKQNNYQPHKFLNENLYAEIWYDVEEV